MINPSFKLLYHTSHIINSCRWMEVDKLRRILHSVLRTPFNFAMGVTNKIKLYGSLLSEGHSAFNISLLFSKGIIFTLVQMLSVNPQM